jgi:hypothetical protein
MNFAFICDHHFQKKAASILANGDIPNHKITTITANDFLESGTLPKDISAVIVEHGTWQKNFSVFRYFGLLRVLEGKPLAFISNIPDVEIKGRGAMKNKDFIINNNIGNPEDISAQLKLLMDAPPPAFTHPKSRAIA